MKIIIKDIEIEIKNKIRAMIIYEQITNTAFNPKTMTDILIYFYSLVIANKPDLNLTFSEFMDYIEENPHLINEFSDWMQSLSKTQNQFADIKKKKGNQ